MNSLTEIQARFALNKAKSYPNGYRRACDQASVPGWLKVHLANAANRGMSLERWMNVGGVVRDRTDRVVVLAG